MPRYDRHYDYGLRGNGDSAAARPPMRAAPRGYDRGFTNRYDYGFRGHPGVHPNRVTARYNRDYVYDERPQYEVNYNAYGGDREGRVGDMWEYIRPYHTIGGTRTYRGSSRPMGWERGYAGYGADYGRYR